MRHPQLSQEYREQIDDTVARLRTRFPRGNKVDLQAVADGLSLRVVRSRKVLVPHATYGFDGNEPYVALSSVDLPWIKDFTFAHELGHLILHRGSEKSVALKEAEADYFAEKVTGKRISPIDYPIQAMVTILMNPEFLGEIFSQREMFRDPSLLDANIKNYSSRAAREAMA